MKVKNLSVVMMDDMVQFLKIEDIDDTAMLVNVNRISSITQKLNGDIEIAMSNEDRILLKGTTIAEITDVIEYPEDLHDEWD